MNATRHPLKTLFRLVLLIACTRSNAYSALWVTGYYPGYKQCDDTQPAGTPNSCDPDDDGTRALMPASEIDFTTVTHVIHFALLPGISVATGAPALDETNLNVNEIFSKQLVTAAHNAKRKVLLAIGGSRTADGLKDSKDPKNHLSTQVQGGFRAATATPEKIDQLVNQLVGLMQKRQYDGIDVDWEPLCFSKKSYRCVPDDSIQFAAFVKSLRAKLNTLSALCTKNAVRSSPCPLLTTATSIGAAHFINTLQDHFDQINVMTYDLGSPWFDDNWMTWFNAPLYNHQTTVIDGDTPLWLPSADASIQEVMNAPLSTSATKIPSTKLGIGIPFYGQYWSGGENLACAAEPCQNITPTDGALQPRLAWTPTQGIAPRASSQYDFNQLMSPANYEKYDPHGFFWDYATESSYVSIDAANKNNDRFISYDDEGAVERKVRYAQSHNLGGVMIWELQAGYLPAPTNNAKATRQPLLNAIRSALTNSTATTTVVYNDALNLWESAAMNAKAQPDFTVKTPPAGTLPAGTRAIKVTSSIIDGTFSLMQSPLGSTLHPARVEKLSFAIYFQPGQKFADTVAVSLENPWGNWFPKLNLTDSILKPILNFPGWYTVEMPITELNPWGRLFNKLNFINLAQQGVDNVFYLNNIEFYGR